MTSFQATLVNAGYGQLALRDQHGKLAQKWTLGHPKCVIGAHANCSVRCMLPGVADHHLLMVIGSRQIYLRALAAGVERDGAAVNELILSGDQAQFAFQLAGHRFEYSRQNHTTPIAKPSVAEAAAPGKPGLATAEQSDRAHQASGRLRFTFVQALEKNRERSAEARLLPAAGDPSAETVQRPAWVEEIVRDALRPVELRLETMAQPINNLERQLRRQRARRRKQQRARNLSQHGAHEVNAAHSEQLNHTQETLQKFVADQSARLELVSEQVSDVVNQLSALERIVSAETDQHQQAACRTTESGAEIVRLQREMLALVGGLQTQIAQPAAANADDAQWRASIQRQLAELQESLGILEEIKTSLERAVAESRELNRDCESRWQRLEQIASRPVIVQSIPVAPTQAGLETYPATTQPIESLPVDSRPVVSPLPLASSAPPAAAPLGPANDRPTEFGEGALSMRVEEQALSDANALDSLSAAGDFRVAASAPGSEPVALPSWWADDPVTSPDETPVAIDPSPLDIRPAGQPRSDEFASHTLPLSAMPPAQVFADEEGYEAASDSRGLSTSKAAEDFASSGVWQPTEYEQEAGMRDSAPAWAYTPPSNGEAPGQYPELDMPQLLTSAIADAPAPSPLSPLAYDEQAYSGHAYAEQTFDAQTSDVRQDIRDASDAISQSTLQIEDQLQKWLADDYRGAGHIRRADDEQPTGAELETTETEPAAEEEFFTGGMLTSAATQQQPSPAADEEYAISAFSDERLTIEEGRLAFPTSDGTGPAPDYGPEAAQDGAENSRLAAYESPYQQPAESTESYSLPSAGTIGGAATAEGGDESVEEYMRRLLARMRGVSESEVKLPGLDGDEQASPQPRPQAQPAAASPTTLNSSPDTEPVPLPATEPFDPANYVRRVAAPEKSRNIDAMRELANTSARSAIHVSARRKHVTAIMIKSGVSLVGLAAGAALVSINGFQMNIGLIATVASFMVALIWGYDALATLRQLLLASQGAKVQLAQPSGEESAEEPS